MPGVAPTCRGGRTWFANGYVVEWAPDHPATSRESAHRQSRLVMECYLGRLLLPDEIVHHGPGGKLDNRIANLVLLDGRSAHGRVHSDDTRERSLAPLTEEQVRAALDGRSTLEAARLLGVHPHTLRNRFPHLLTVRRSPGGPLPPDLAERVRGLALDPSMGTRQAARTLQVTCGTLREWTKLAGVQWTPAPRGRPKRSASSADARR